VLSAIGSQGKVLLLTEGAKENVYLSARNLETVIVRPFGEESAYDILWATTLVIEKAALDGAEPSDAHRSAVASRARGEPDVRVRERAAEEERLERRKLKRGHGKKAASKVKKEVKAAPKTKETVAGKAAPKAKDETKAKAAPKAKDETKSAAAPKAKAPTEATGGVDASSVTLPKVGDLADFLAGFDSAADVETLRARDDRKTAQARYEARLVELGDKESDDA
jgi:hypothetical protein